MLAILVATAFSTPQDIEVKEELVFDLPKAPELQMEGVCLTFCPKEDFSSLFGGKDHVEVGADLQKELSWMALPEEKQEPIAMEEAFPRNPYVHFLYENGETIIICTISFPLIVWGLYAMVNSSDGQIYLIKLERRVGLAIERDRYTIFKNTYQKSLLNGIINNALMRDQINEDVKGCMLRFSGDHGYLHFRMNHPCDGRWKTVKMYMKAIFCPKD